MADRQNSYRQIVELVVKDNRFSEIMKDAAQSVSGFEEAVKGAERNTGSFNIDDIADSAKDVKQNLDESTRSAKGFTDSMLGTAAGQAAAWALSKAWQTVRDSIGGAIARIDTMEQFDSTMTRITGSSEQADAMLRDLNDTVTGTSFGLDTAAEAAQGFVTSGLKIEEATKYVESWGDAVAFYGDGSNAQFESVTRAMRQMAAKGKASFQEIRTATDAGIPVLEIYADAVGKSTDEVSKQLSNGEITAKDFLAEIDKAFREGTKNFQSIDNAAKEAGASWEATIGNAKFAVVRGVQSIIEEIEKVRAEGDKATMRETIADAGRTAEEVLDKIGKAIGKAIEIVQPFEGVIVDTGKAFLLWKAGEVASEHLKKLVSSVKEAHTENKQLIEGFKKGEKATELYANAIKSEEDAMKIRAAAKKLNLELNEKDMSALKSGKTLTDANKLSIMAEAGALSAKELVLATLSGQMKATTAVQYGLNAAFKANPIGAIILIIQTAVKAYKLLDKWLSKTTDEQKKQIQAAEDLANENKDLIEQTDKLKGSYERSNLEIEANAKQAKKLIDRLKELESSSSDTESKQREMASAVKELKRLYPDLTVEFNEAGDAILGGTKAIEGQIEALNGLSRVKVHSEFLEDLTEQQIQLEVQIESTKKLIQDMEDSGAATKAFGIKTAEYKELLNNLDDLESRYKSVGSQIDTIREKQGEASQTEAEYREQLDETTYNLEYLRDAYGLTSQAILEYSDSMGESVEEAGDKIAALAEQYNMSTDEIMAAVMESGGSIEEWAAAHEAATERVKAAYDDYFDKVMNGFSEIGQAETIGLSEFQDNLESNIAAMEKWSSNIALLAQAGVHEGILEQLRALGPEGGEQTDRFVQELTELNDGTDISLGNLNETARSRIEELNNIFEESSAKFAESVETLVNPEDFESHGMTIQSAIARGIIDYQDKPREAIGETYEGMIEQSAEGSSSFGEAAAGHIGGGYSRMAEAAEEGSEELHEIQVIHLDETTDDIKGSLDDRYSAYDEHYKNTSKATKEFADETETEIIDLNKNVLEDTKSTVADYENEIIELRKKLAEETAKISKNTEEEIVDMNKVVIDDTGRTVEDYKKRIAELSIKVVEETKNMTDDTEAEVIDLNKTVLDDTKQTTDEIESDVKELDKTVVNEARKTADEAMRHAQTGLENIERQFEQSGRNITNTAGNIRQGIVSEFNAIENDMYNTGVNIANGLIRGLNDSAPAIYQTAQNIAQNVQNTIAQSLEIQSPSRVMQRMGRFVGKGLEGGLDDSVYMLKKAAKRLSDAATPAIDLDRAGLQQLEVPRTAITSMHEFNAAAASAREGVYELLYALGGFRGKVSNLSMKQTLNVDQAVQAQARPAQITLQLGGTEFRTFIDDITRAQNKRLEMSETYAI